MGKREAEPHVEIFLLFAFRLFSISWWFKFLDPGGETFDYALLIILLEFLIYPAGVKLAYFWITFPADPYEGDLIPLAAVYLPLC